MSKEERRKIMSENIQKNVVDRCSKIFGDTNQPHYVQLMKDRISPLNVVIKAVSEVMAEELDKMIPRKKR